MAVDTVLVEVRTAKMADSFYLDGIPVGVLCRGCLPGVVREPHAAPLADHGDLPAFRRMAVAQSCLFGGERLLIGVERAEPPVGFPAAVPGLRPILLQRVHCIH